MQSPDDGDDLIAIFVCKDPDSLEYDDCPAFYRTDRGTWIGQGKRRGPGVAAQLRSLAEDETFCEFPDPLMDLVVRIYVKERYGIDLGGAAQ
ncbi:hypothetical protein [Actinocorallia sp. A-T 12471]|uniref:hypothetical protein n=1 Tax=Actinocorallia sp. A-T 12471 TaxID=3089813 RepID=UPI0029CBAC27|nr:hypothetical protein [Actinocorallia sp. A-T 12471]MDX6740490.1 hypothetical protein [Actinocorallia sp. A-T 12471]